MFTRKQYINNECNFHEYYVQFVDETTKEYVLKVTFEETMRIFTHDESGQFQTYFSVWEVLN